MLTSPRENCDEIWKQSAVKPNSKLTYFKLADKGTAFEELLQRRDRDTHDRYRAQRAVKQAVKVAKRMVENRSVEEQE